MTKFLGKVVIIDVEGKSFHVTIDGVNWKEYTFDQIIDCQHLIDNPGYDSASEAAHLNAKPESGTDRGAQPYTAEQINRYITNLERLGRKHLLLPGAVAKRVMFEMGEYAAKDACLAWWHYCNTKPKIVDMVRELTRTTDGDLRRNTKLNAARADSSRRVDSAASRKYNTTETEDARRIIERAERAGVISPMLRDEFEIKFIKSGKRKGLLVFSPAKLMPLYVAACEQGGYYRCDASGNPIGIRTVIGGILQHHAFKSGKGSNASPRAKTRGRLKLRENQYREENGIPKQESYPEAIPCVRKHHEQMNKELVRLFRDYADRR